MICKRITFFLCLISFCIADEVFETSTNIPTTTEDFTEISTLYDFTEETTTEVEMTDDPDTLVTETSTVVTETVASSTTSVPKPTTTKIMNKRNPIVKIEEGSLKGVFKKGFYHFMGIKYGQAPIGERR